MSDAGASMSGSRPPGESEPTMPDGEQPESALKRLQKRMGVRPTVLLHDPAEADSPVVGETLLGSAIRARTGVSVIALLRAEESVPSPPPEIQFGAGDTLVVIGLRDQVDRFLQTFTRIAHTP